MSLNQPETQALRSIADGLAGSDPRLAAMLTIFSQLAAGEEMLAREKIRARRGRLGWQQAMLVLGAVIAAGVRDRSRQWHSGSSSRAETTWRCKVMVAGFHGWALPR
jgi:hypothetical protein